MLTVVATLRKKALSVTTRTLPPWPTCCAISLLSWKLVIVVKHTRRNLPRVIYTYAYDVIKDATAKDAPINELLTTFSRELSASDESRTLHILNALTW